MALLLTGDRDQALLAMVIQEAHAVAEEQGGFVGRTAVQKIMYFLKAMDVPMDYSFDIYRYGPFCAEILRDTDWLAADHVIVDTSQKRGYSNYEPAESIDELLALYLEELEPFREGIRELVQALIPLRPERLELLATLDYIGRQQRGAGTEPSKDSVLSKFMELKEDKFPREEVESAYDAMAKAGLV